MRWDYARLNDDKDPKDDDKEAKTSRRSCQAGIDGPKAQN